MAISWVTVSGWCKAGIANAQETERAALAKGDLRTAAYFRGMQAAFEQINARALVSY